MLCNQMGKREGTGESEMWLFLWPCCHRVASVTTKCLWGNGKVFLQARVFLVGRYISNPQVTSSRFICIA
jgi:hypothetical protein